MVSIRQIGAMARKVAAEFKPEKIILFGSYAYGKPGPDSDIDLLVILPHKGPAARKASEIRLALPDDVSVDVVVRSPETVQKRLAMNDFFFQEIFNKGRTLYEAGNA